jgi:molybdate transport system substrate-binding protein
MQCANAWRALALGLCVCAAYAFPGAVSAAELTVYSGGAAKSGLNAVIPAFEAQSKNKIAIQYAPMGALKKKLTAGDVPDVVVLTQEVMKEAAEKGWVDTATVSEVGRVGVGVAVNEKALAPDISTPAAFKKTLLDAKSIIMINPKVGTSGKHLASVFEKLGVADALQPKLNFLDGGYVVEAVGRGEVELGLHQITEILPVKGIKLVGPLPAELQKVTVYVGALTAKTRDPALAKAFLAYIRTPEARAAFVKKGYMAEGS